MSDVYEWIDRLSLSALLLAAVALLVASDMLDAYLARREAR